MKSIIYFLLMLSIQDFFKFFLRANTTAMVDSSNECEVILNITASSAREGRSVNNKSTCQKPQENKMKFHNCTPSGKQEFPSENAECNCTKCKGAAPFKLDCFDGKWYPSVVPFGCEDVYTDNPNITCNFKKETLNGTNVFIPTKCFCKKTCIELNADCPLNNGSKINETCNEKKMWNKTSLHLTWTIENGLYNYTCDEGYTMTGNSSIRCNEGKLQSKKPTCILKESSPSSMPLQYIYFAAAIPTIISTLLIVYIIYLKCFSTRSQLKPSSVELLQAPHAQVEQEHEEYEYIDPLQFQGDYSMPYSTIIRNQNSNNVANMRDKCDLTASCTIDNDIYGTSVLPEEQ